MNRIKNKIKKLPIIKQLYTIIKFKNEFNYDYRFFIKNYSHSKENQKKIGYNILLISHSLEKGLSNVNSRYFGIEKIDTIIELLNKYKKYNGYSNEYDFITGINILRSYTKFYEKNDWTDRNEYHKAKEFIEQHKEIKMLNVGSFNLHRNDFIDNAKIDYNSFLESRHSVRCYENKKISKNDIEKAINMTLKTPTACNRQMIKIYYVNDKEKANEVIKIGQGFSGFDLKGINIFLITFDVNANYFIGERNQGWFNAGLTSMNFVNALHSLGIGSCFIQFGNTTKEEEKIKKMLNIPNSERVAVLLSAGYYKNNSLIPYSPRKSIDDVYRVID